MKIGLVVAATGKYRRFVTALWLSAQKNWLQGHSRTLYLLTDVPVDNLADSITCFMGHERWPGPTLHRYRCMVAHENILRQCDYLYMCDADMAVIGTVGDEILGDLVATIHPGFFRRPPDQCTYDRNPQCGAYVPFNTSGRYYAGGFQGGQTSAYLEAVSEMARRIEKDEERGIIPLWHDESHWNRYLIDFPPTVELSPSYCFPEGWNLPFRPLIVALNKDHAEVRA